MITFTQIPVFSPLVFRNLAVSPLVVSNPRADDYSTLDEALTTGRVRITEVGEAGSVPELKLLNDTDHPILLLDGEELAGAKQNRICNLTILAPPRAETIIPVSCVEAGRWSWRSQAFSTSGNVHFAGSRARKARDVSEFSLSTLRVPCETGFDLERHLQQTRPAGHAIGHGSHVRCHCPAQ
jgi:ARG and Rhodanese-Phosphatase-superfamily-associated Protein domain